jgi:hypothetical protein
VGRWKRWLADPCCGSHDARTQVSLRPCWSRPKRQWTNRPQAMSRRGPCALAVRLRATVNCDGRACGGDEVDRELVSGGLQDSLTCTPCRFSRVQVHVPCPSTILAHVDFSSMLLRARLDMRGRLSMPSSWSRVEAHRGIADDAKAKGAST